MSIASSTVGFFRDQWAARFVDSVVVKRRDPDNDTFDDGTGQTTLAFEDTNPYSGVALIRPGSGSDIDFGEQSTAVRVYRVFLPHDETDPLPGDLVDVTSTRDGYLDGNTLIVTGVRADTYNTVRVLDCEENQDD